MTGCCDSLIQSSERLFPMIGRFLCALILANLLLRLGQKQLLLVAPANQAPSFDQMQGGGRRFQHLKLYFQRQSLVGAPNTPAGTNRIAAAFPYETNIFGLGGTP